jgi:hypothetical protein
MDLTMMERVGDRWKKIEGSCSTGQSPQRAVVPVEEEEEEEERINMEYWWNDTDMAKPKYSEINLSQFKFVHYTPHADWAGTDPGPSW